MIGNAQKKAVGESRHRGNVVNRVWQSGSGSNQGANRQHLSQHTQPIDIHTLKKFASNNLSPGSPLRNAILNDSDELSVETYLGRIGAWLILLEMGTGK